MVNGILNVKKEKGFTSHDVVAKLRGILGQRKIGHTGTLDPDATGVLPVCAGNATKVCDMLTDSDKEYRAVMLLGKTTDTQDVTGEILAEHEVNVSKEQVMDAIQHYIGEISQIPPMYSALKVNGQKLCDLARKGIEVERKPRPVRIYSIEVEQMDLPRVQMLVSCSKGTYIRTLIHDIGASLGTGACMESLIRTKAAGFRIENARTLSEIETMVKMGKMNELLVPTDSVFGSFPAVTTNAQGDRLLLNGNHLGEEDFSDSPEQAEQIRVYDSNGNFQAVYAKKDQGRYVPVKMFLDRN